MNRMNSKNDYGFTLIELILALSLISLVIILSVNLIIFGTKSHKTTVKEYDMQSALRRAAEETNQIVRYSKAVFAVPQTFVSSTNVMDPGWDFFMVSPDGKRIVIMEYNEDTHRHEEKVIVGEQENIVYEIIFEKDTSAKTDSVMKYKIYAYVVDNDGNKKREKLVFESLVESVNAVQVVDKGSVSSPSIALAFRNDGQTSGKGKNQIAYITIVVDVSGSMLANPDGNYWPNYWEPQEFHDSRIKHVRKALTGDESNPEMGIIQQFSNEENIYISLVPFSTTGNYPNPIANTEPNMRHPIYEVYIENKKKELINIIKSMEAIGGTNTGDGLRQVYYLHKDFRKRMNIDEKIQVQHYMILLVDGETTFEVNNGTWKDYGFYTYSGYPEYIDRMWYERFNWTTYWRFNFDIKNPYLNVGNINIDTVPDDKQLTKNQHFYGNINYKSYYGWLDNYYKGNIVTYGSKNDNVSNYSITGDGNTVIENSPYVEAVGKLIKKFNNGNGIKSYIIGYAGDLGTHVNSIGRSIGTEKERIYKYDDPGFNLDEIFENIANDIMADFWLVSGPQIQE